MQRHMQIPNGLLHICPQYGEGRGPCSSQECTNLHVCRPWLAGYCKMSTSCDFDHSLLTPQNKRILEEKRIDLSTSEEDLRQRIRKSMPNICVHHFGKNCAFGKYCNKIRMCRALLTQGLSIKF